MGAASHRQFSKITVPPVIVFLLFSSSIMAQQKVQFTQYMFNNLVINPAYAGAEEALSLTFIHRNQWAGVEGAPSTQTLSAHSLFKKKQIGLGLTLINDKIGVHKKLNVMTNYAYHLKVGFNAYLSFGLQAGIHSRKSDYSSLIQNSVNDPNLNSAFFSHTFFDFGMGLYFRSPRLHIGFSVPQLRRDRIILDDTVSVEFSKINNFLFSSYRIPLNQNVVAEPSVLLKYLHGVPLSFDINMNMIFRNVLTVGLSYRKHESIDFLLKCQVTPQLEFGYAYDYPFGNISRLSHASHEIMVHYLFRFMKMNVTSPR